MCQGFLVVVAHKPSTTRLRKRRVSSLELGSQFHEAAGDPARDRAGRQVERLADALVALVTGEEAVEDLAAVAREASRALRGRRAPRRAWRSSRRRLTARAARPAARVPRREACRGRAAASAARATGGSRSSSRSFGRFTYARAKTSWKTSSASASAGGTPGPRSRRRSGRSARRARATRRRPPRGNGRRVARQFRQPARLESKRTGPL